MHIDHNYCRHSVLRDYALYTGLSILAACPPIDDDSTKFFLYAAGSIVSFGFGFISNTIVEDIENGVFDD